MPCYVIEKPTYVCVSFLPPKEGQVKDSEKERRLGVDFLGP